MEENNVKVKNKAKITVVALLAFLLLGAAVCAAILLMPKKDDVDNGEIVIKYEEEETASDEATLRALLAYESNMIIEVTEDIMINQPITVTGGKKLTGDGTIAMELYVKPYQYMFVVENDSKLELDGVTIDGNGSSNCVKVEKNAQFALLSGKLTYGCPTVIESFGNVYIKGGAVVDAIGTGVYVHSGGNVYMTAGSIRGCVDCGIEGAVDSYISISDKAMLHDNMEYFIYSKGTCDITGGELRDAQSDMVYTSGVMNVKYEGKKEGDMLEWHDIKGCAFTVGNGGELNVDNLHVTNVENRVVTTAVGKSVANISNCLFENTGGAAVYVRTEANLKNVEIINAGYGSQSAGTGGHSGIMLIETGKATIDNVTITGTVKDGIQNAGGIVTGKNLVVNSAGRIGVNTYKYNDVEGSVKLDNVTINGTKTSNGLHVETSTLTVSNVKIKDVAGEGARAQKGGKLNITNIEIENAKGRNITSNDEGSKVVVKNAKVVGGQRGLGAFGGDITATNITIDSPTEYGVTASKNGSVKVTDVTIKDSAGTAVNANAATITINKATIENTKATAGLNADYDGKITLKNADIKFDKNADEGIDGVRAYGTAMITLENVDITDAPNRSIYASGEKAKIVAKDVTATGGKRGIQIYKGGQVEGKKITLKSLTEYGVSCGDAGSGFVLTDLTVTDCGKHAVNVYDSAVAEVTGGTFTKTADLGVFVGNKGKLTLNDVVVSKTTNSGMMNENATLFVKNGSIKGAGDRGVYTSKGGQTTLKNFTTTDGKRGIQIYSGGKVTGETVTILSPEEYGVACGDEGSSFDITNLTVSRKGDAGVSSGKHAINVYDGAIATVTTGTIAYPGGNGVNLDNGAELTLDNVKIEKAGAYAVHTAKAKLVLKGTIEIIEPTDRGIVNVGGTVDGKDAIVTVDNPGSFGISTNVSTEKVEVEGVEKTVETPGTTTIGELNISSAGEEKNAYSSMTVNGVGTVVTVYKGEITDSWKHGINVEKGTLNLSNFSIENSGQEKADNGEYDNVQAQAASTINLSNVEITGGSNGVNISNSGTVIGSDTVTITSPAKYGVKCNGGNFTLVDLNVTDSGSHAVNVYGSGTGTITGGYIDNAAVNGVNVEASVITLNNVDIMDSGSYGVNLQDSASGTMTGGMVEDSGKKGIYLHKYKTSGASIALTDVQINDSTEENLYLHDASSVTVNGTLDTQGGTHALAIYGGSTVVAGADYEKITIDSHSKIGVRIYNSGSKLDVADMEITGGTNGIEMDTGTTVNLAGNVSLSDMTGNNDDGGNGIFMKFGGTLNATNATISINKVGFNAVYVKDGTINASTSTINITGGCNYGLRANGGTTTIGKLNIDGAKAHSAVRAQGSSVVTINGGTIKNSVQNGVNVLNTANLTMKNVTVSTSGQKDILREHDTATITLTNVTYSTGYGK